MSYPVSQMRRQAQGKGSHPRLSQACTWLLALCEATFQHVGTHEPWVPVLMSEGAQPNLLGQQPREEPSKDPRASNVKGLSCVTNSFLSLQMQSRAAVPGPGWALTRRTASPSRWVSLGKARGGGQGLSPSFIWDSFSEYRLCAPVALCGPHTYEWSIPHSYAMG